MSGEHETDATMVDARNTATPVSQLAKLARKPEPEMLIADINDLLEAKAEVRFYSKERYEQNFGEMDQMEVDSTAVLILKENDYLPKPNFYREMEVDMLATKEDRQQERNEAFAAKMASLSLSDEAFTRQTHFEKLSKEQATYSTPGGDRTRNREYRNPMQAGEKSPDMLRRVDEGTYLGFYPALDSRFKGGGLEQLYAVIGKENLRLKGIDNVYRTPASLNERTNNPRAAENAYSKFQNVRRVVRTDLAPALVQMSSGGKTRYVSKATYDQLLKNGRIPGLEEDPTKLKTLVFNKDTGTYLQPRGLKLAVAGKEGEFSSRMKEAGLPPRLGDRTITHAAAVLYRQANSSALTSTNNPQDLKNIPDKDIFVQNLSAAGKYTGNFTDLATQRDRGKLFNREQTRLLGQERTLSQRSVEPSLNTSAGGNVVELPSPARQRGLDERPREAAGRV